MSLSTQYAHRFRIVLESINRIAIQDPVRKIIVTAKRSEIGPQDTVEVTVHMAVADVRDPEKTIDVLNTDRWDLSMLLESRQQVRVVRDLVHRMLMHELDEWLTYDGQQATETHTPLKDL